jgi:hypothetical protein
MIVTFIFLVTNTRALTYTIPYYDIRTLQIRNLQEIDMYHVKLIFFLMVVAFPGLDKHASLLWNP